MTWGLDARRRFLAGIVGGDEGQLIQALQLSSAELNARAGGVEQLAVAIPPVIHHVTIRIAAGRFCNSIKCEIADYVDPTDGGRVVGHLKDRGVLGNDVGANRGDGECGIALRWAAPWRAASRRWRPFVRR